MPLHFFFHLEVLVGKSLAHVLGLHREHRLEGFLFTAEHLHLFLVVLQLISKLHDHLFEGAQLALQVSGVGC